LRRSAIAADNQLVEHRAGTTRTAATICVVVAVIGGLFGGLLTIVHGRIQEDAGICLNTLPLGLPVLVLSLMAGIAAFRGRRRESGLLVAAALVVLVAAGTYVWVLSTGRIDWGQSATECL
jgi:hypothetical protein